jgi:heptosyltransferase II
MATRKPQFFETAEPETAPSAAFEAQWAAEGTPIPQLVRKLSPAPGNILVKQVNWLGDLVMSLPALHAIRDAFPSSPLSVLVRRELAGLFDGADWITEVIPYRVRNGPAGLLDRASIVREIRSRRFDLAVLFPSSFQAALWVTLAGVPRRAGYVADHRGFMLTHRITPRPQVQTVHQVHHWLTMVAETVGAPGSVEMPPIDVDLQSRERMGNWLSKRRVRPDRPLIAVAPVAAYGPAKEWPPARYAELVDILAARHKAECVLVGGGDDRQRCEQISTQTTAGAIVAAGETSVGELIALLSLCHAFAGNDSGCMHLAGALGMPTVAIFGSTNPARTGPMGRQVRIIYRGIDCSPCLQRTCRFGHYKCLNEVTAVEVAEALEEFGVFA